jgi:hypothetical protein
LGRNTRLIGSASTKTSVAFGARVGVFRGNACFYGGIETAENHSKKINSKKHSQ